MENKDKFERVEFPDYLLRDIHEHEIVMSFFDDDAAVAFEEWWEVQGSVVFNKYYKTVFKSY